MVQSLNSSRFLFNQSPPTPKPPRPCVATAIIDMGTSGHYLITNPSHSHAIHPTINLIMVQLPNGSKIVSTHTTAILQPEHHLMAGHAHIFPNHSLISVSQLCDHRCKALFTANHMVMSIYGKLILTGNQSPNGLWTTCIESLTDINMQAKLVYDHSSLSAFCMIASRRLRLPG